MTIFDIERWLQARGEACVVIMRNPNGEISVSMADETFIALSKSKQGVSQALENALAEFQGQKNEFDSAPVTQKIIFKSENNL